jgi:hypothetical protein
VGTAKVILAGRRPSSTAAGRALRGIRAVRALNGELSLRTFETYESAGPLVSRELDEAERLRHSAARNGSAGFRPGAAGRLLSVWNAYVLQTVGEHLLDAVRRRSLGTVRAGVAGRILTFLGPADRWMSQARRTAADPSHRVDDQVLVPAEPPVWPNQKHGPYPLSEAMANALRAVHTRGDATLTTYVHSPVWRGEDLLRLHGMLDAAATAIEYAEGPPAEDMFWGVSTALHLRYALRLLFLFGQVAADPVLLDTNAPARIASLTAHVRPDADAWSLTDPAQRDTLRALPSARAAIQHLWAADPATAETLRVQTQIDAALRSGAITFATDRAGERLGSFHRCPWPAVYEARRPVGIGGTSLMPMQQFTFDVLGETQGGAAPYTRRLVVSDFVPAEPLLDAGARTKG